MSYRSAWSTGKVRRSHVLLAMGVPPELASCALRVSFGSTSSRADVIRFLRELENSLGSRKDSRGVRAA